MKYILASMIATVLIATAWVSWATAMPKGGTLPPTDNLPPIPPPPPSLIMEA